MTGSLTAAAAAAAAAASRQTDQPSLRSSHKDSKTCRQLLGELFADREYLEKLLMETGRSILTGSTGKNLETFFPVLVGLIVFVVVA